MSDLPDRFEEFEQARLALARAKMRGEDVGDLLHEANNLTTAALVWIYFDENERAELVARMDALLGAFAEWRRARRRDSPTT